MVRQDSFLSLLVLRSCVPSAVARFLRSVVALFFVTFVPLHWAVAQDEDEHHEVLFTLDKSFLESLAEHRGIRYTMSLQMNARSKVHRIKDDCEIHIAAELSDPVSFPPAVVVEPPNVCRQRVGGVSKSGAIGKAWEDYFDAEVMNRQCDVTGFPRIYSEHRTSGAGSPSNPFHVLELHPALRIECDGAVLDFSQMLKIWPGMSRIKDSSAAICLEDRRLYVRLHADEDHYDFAEEGGKGPGGQCGNFIEVWATVNPEFIREFGKDQTSGRGDHSGIAWVQAGEYGPFSLKLYTYRGTPEDAALIEIQNGVDPDRELHLHGMLTYDYFAVIRAVQDENRNWLDSIDEWKEVPFPLTLVVFGTPPSD